MNRFMKTWTSCPKSCFQYCEYSSECIAQIGGWHIFMRYIASKVKPVINRIEIILRRLFRMNGADKVQTKDTYQPIHPSAKYVFTRIDQTSTYLLGQHIGKHLIDTSKVYLEKSPIPLICSYILLDGKYNKIDCLTFLPEFKQKASASYGNHAILVELSDDLNEMTLLLFENLGLYHAELFQRRNAGELIVDVEIKPVSDLGAGKYPFENSTHNKV